MRARRWLTDADRLSGRRDASLPVYLDEQPEAGGVPEKRKCAIGHGDTTYRKVRLARSQATAYREARQ